MDASAQATIAFTLSAAEFGVRVDVVLRRAGERWVASVSGDSHAVGLASSAGAALSAALEPLGQPIVVKLMADLALLEPSVWVARLERSARSA